MRLVYGLRPRDHVSAAAFELHWLPVEARIQFKPCLLVHLSLSLIGNVPSYTTDLLQPVSTRGTVQPHGQTCRYIPRTRLMFGERAFSVAAPKAWNNLPAHIRTAVNTDTFKGRLKTFLFCKFYQLPLPADFYRRCTLVQSAVLRSYIVRLSVRPSVTFRYRDHIGWNSSKIISRPNSLRPLLWLTPAWAIWCNGNTPKLGRNRGGVWSTKNLQYLRKGARYDQGYGLIGSHIRAFDWHQNHCP